MLALGCGGARVAPAPMRAATCSPDNGGLTLPAGFCAQVVADSVGRARHIVALPDGGLAVAVEDARNAPNSGGIMILRDADGDGVMESRRRFGPRGGSGIAMHDGHLYLALNNAVLRWRWQDGAMEAAGAGDTVVSGLPFGRQHAAKTIAIGAGNALYVNVGAPSNACQSADRQPGVAGMDPCGILDSTGGIWRFDAGRTGQTRANGRRFATGLRNMVALSYDPGSSTLYGVQHGRDDLARLWPALYTTQQNAEKPAEELFALEDGGDYGWPYCMYDSDLRQKILAPEYGGDGRTVGRCAQTRQPLAAYPAHYAPNGVLVYRGTQFPEPYRGGMFIAFHGSWNRAPMPQDGYNVVFQPFANGRPSGQWTVFAQGFWADRAAPARNRPTGLAVGSDGSLYVTDDTGGRIYRISYR